MASSDDKQEYQEDDEDTEGCDDADDPRRQRDLITHPGIRWSSIQWTNYQEQTSTQYVMSYS